MTRRRDGRLRDLVAGADVMLVGLFSAKDREVEANLDHLAASVQALGARVVGRHVQRRGVSHGGARKMARPLSRRTLLSPGKIREVAEACRSTRVAAAVFLNPLTEHQRTVLSDIFDCPVVSSEDVIERP